MRKYDWPTVLQEILDIQLLSEILKQQPNQQDTEAERRTIETPLSPSAIFAWLSGVYETLASNDQSNRTLTSMIVLDQNTRNEEVDEALAMAKLLLYKELVSELKNNSNLAETRIYKILDKLRSTGLVGDSTVITGLINYLNINITGFRNMPDNIFYSLEQFSVYLLNNPRSPLWVLYQVVESALNPAIFYGNELSPRDLETFPIADSRDGGRTRQTVLSRSPYQILAINHLTNPSATRLVSSNIGSGIRSINTRKAYELLRKGYEEWIKFIKEIGIQES